MEQLDASIRQLSLELFFHFLILHSFIKFSFSEYLIVWFELLKSLLFDQCVQLSFNHLKHSGNCTLGENVAVFKGRFPAGLSMFAAVFSYVLVHHVVVELENVFWCHLVVDFTSFGFNDIGLIRACYVSNLVFLSALDLLRKELLVFKSGILLLN